jgi:hypothetical protein
LGACGLEQDLVDEADGLVDGVRRQASPLTLVLELGETGVAVGVKVPCGLAVASL